MKEMIKEKGMFDSDRCGFCHDFGEKAKPFICENCWKGIDVFIQQAINEERERIIKELLQNPYPKWLFPMTTDEFVKAIPDKKLRGAISGYMGRGVWDNCIKSIEEVIRED